MIQARMTAGKGGKVAIKALKDQATQDMCRMLSKYFLTKWSVIPC